MNKVEKLFKNEAIYMHNIPVYSKKVAINIIKECKKHQIDIVAIDAYIVKEKFHQPSMDNSIGFTISPYRENPPDNVWDFAVSFLEARDEKYCFEITFLE